MRIRHRHFWFVAFLVCSGLLVGLTYAGDVQAARMKAVSGDMLRQRIPGTIIHLDTPLGTVVPIRYNKDGTMVGSAGAVAFYLGSSSDRGRWWVAGRSLCHKWRNWFSGKPKCITIDRDRNKINWKQDDGKTGTATIIRESYQVAKKKKTYAKPSTLGGPLEVRNTSKTQPLASQRPASILNSARRKPSANAKPSETRRTATRTRPGKKRTSSKAVNRVAKTQPSEDLRLFRVVRVAQNDVLNIRRRADADSAIVATLPATYRGVSVTGPCQGWWCPIESDRGRGWVSRYYLEKDTSPRPLKRFAVAKDKPFPSRAPTYRPGTYRVAWVALGDELNIRKAPSGRSEVVTALAPLTTGIRMVGLCRGDWCPVQFGNFRGWAHAMYLSPETSTQTATR